VDGWIRAKPKPVGAAADRSLLEPPAAISLVFGRRPWMDQEESRRGEAGVRRKQKGRGRIHL